MTTTDPQSLIPNTSSAIMALESSHTSGVYPKRPLAVVRGQGAHLWDADGREYIDCVGGQGAANLGHAHPAILAAISQQAATLISCPEIFYNDRRAELLARLTEAAPAGMSRAFLCNSGAEANEAALKFARLSTGRTGVIATVRGFHGRTMGALSATWNKEYRTPFEPLVPGFSHVPYNDLAALEKTLTDQTAAVILEVVQGEGGVHPGTPEYLHGSQALCRERGALLILDEVQTGYGRTGKLFACQHYGLEPDLMSVAKSMAGGLPMGACLIGSRVQNIAPMTHGSTFGGNPLACAAAIATLDTMRGESAPLTPQPWGEPSSPRSRGAGGATETLPDRAARLGSHLKERLSAIQSPLIREVRGLGLLVGVDLRVKVTPILQKLQALGVLALPAGSTVLRLLPPLVIEEEDLERVVEAVATALS
ncbi:MAG: aspartate aminotransferase family protein [Chloroflexi bacterium]|nr:aspartate aminotransferase family protein [Chloroflexota bacterium]